MDPERSIPVSLFFTCLADAFYPRAAFAAVEVLERFGAEVRVPLSQTCCGQPAFNSGNRKGTPVLRVKLDGKRREVDGFPRDREGTGVLEETLDVEEHGLKVMFDDPPEALPLPPPGSAPD